MGARLMRQMPVVIAMGVNLGIVPLLFVQVAYHRAFYPATILMAWSWFATVLLLIPAYYGVYVYALALRRGAIRPLERVAGWMAAVLFVCIGFLFANGFTLMTRVEAWPELLRAHSVAGAATGTALNTGDPTFWPRWLLMFGLASRAKTLPRWPTAANPTSAPSSWNRSARTGAPAMSTPAATPPRPSTSFTASSE